MKHLGVVAGALASAPSDQCARIVPINHQVSDEQYLGVEAHGPWCRRRTPCESLLALPRWLPF
jgi:hypothetical protein